MWDQAGETAELWVTAGVVAQVTSRRRAAKRGSAESLLLCFQEPRSAEEGWMKAVVVPQILAQPSLLKGVARPCHQIWVPYYLLSWRPWVGGWNLHFFPSEKEKGFNFVYRSLSAGGLPLQSSFNMWKSSCVWQSDPWGDAGELGLCNSLGFLLLQAAEH